MNVPAWLVLNVYVGIIAVMLLAMTVSKKMLIRQDRSFVFMLAVILVLLFADSFHKAQLGSTLGQWLCHAGTYIVFAADPVGYLSALVYIDSWTAGTKDHAEKLFYYVVICYVIVNFVLVTVSAVFRLDWFYYYLDTSYQHGRLYVVRGLMNMAFCAFISLYIFLRRRKIMTNYTTVVVLFPLCILLAGFLQVFIGGASYEYAGSVLACLMLFLKVQAHNVDTDYLTGLLNRRGIASQLEYQCTHYRSRHSFLVYMIDIDFFKQINDKYGHHAGDEALKALAGLLLDTFGKKASIGRYGGDEFLVIDFESSKQGAEKKLKELDSRCQIFNQHGKLDCPLSFSAGFAFYDPEIYSDVYKFFHHIDELMYEQKRSHHALRNNKSFSESLYGAGFPV